MQDGAQAARVDLVQWFRDWWSALEPNGDYLFAGVAVASTLIGLWLCYRMYRILPARGNFVHEIPRLISHVPSSTVTAQSHILAGVFLFGGVSLLAGILSGWLFTSHMDARSFMSSNTDLTLGVLSLSLGFWTLYQTKRLERLQGEGIQRFDHLVASLTEAVEELIEKWDENRDKSSTLFRVYVVTNNPYFGINSYPGKRVTLDYEAAFKKLAVRIREYRRQGTTSEAFRLKIICADRSRMDEFNGHYTDKIGYDKATRSRLSEEFVGECMACIEESAVVRLPMLIAEVQFVVIGDTVFEFILESPADDAAKSRGSNIRNTTRIEDRAVADRFERYVRFLETLARLGSTSEKQSALTGIQSATGQSDDGRSSLAGSTPLVSPQENASTLDGPTAPLAKQLEGDAPSSVTGA